MFDYMDYIGLHIYVDDEMTWKSRFFISFDKITKRYECRNSLSETVNYTVNSEKELREKQNERVNVGWIKI